VLSIAVGALGTCLWFYAFGAAIDIAEMREDASEERAATAFGTPFSNTPVSVYAGLTTLTMLEEFAALRRRVTRLRPVEPTGPSE
jgi:hypothetical protein